MKTLHIVILAVLFAVLSIVGVTTNLDGISSVKIETLDSQSMDAGGRWRVSSPQTIFDSKQIFDNEPLLWDEELVLGSGITASHSIDSANTRIVSTDNVAGHFIRQTFMRFNYQPGKSQLVLLSGVIQSGGGGPGVFRGLGLSDDQNGMFFADREGIINVGLRTNASGTPVDSLIPQSEWNLDRMNGSGASGVIADFSKAQIFVIDFEWLGVGRVRMGLVIDGITVYVHQFVHANIASSVYMSAPNLPIRCELITTGASPATSIELICATVMSEGGNDDIGLLRYASTENVDIDAMTPNVIYSVLGIRLKFDHIAATVNIVKSSISELKGAKNLEWMLVLNPTIAGTPAWTDQTNSSLQTFVAVAANTITGGTIIDGGYFSSDKKGGSGSEDIKNGLRLGAAIDGTVDEIVLVVRPINGSMNSEVVGSITWREVY